MAGTGGVENAVEKPMTTSDHSAVPSTFKVGHRLGEGFVELRLRREDDAADTAGRRGGLRRPVPKGLFGTGATGALAPTSQAMTARPATTRAIATAATRILRPVRVSS